MSPFDIFHRATSNMMDRFGTDATIVVISNGEYDETTSEYTETDVRYRVRAIFMDAMKHTSGDRSRTNTLIEEGDRQVFIQPIREEGVKKLPTLTANKDTLEINGSVFKLVFIKQLNTTMQDCILYECYCRQ